MLTLEKSPLLANINKLYISLSDLCGVYVTPDFSGIKPSDIVAINVTGREWFDKINGNSYNDFNIEFALKSGNKSQCIYGVFAYGYGDYYMQRARVVLKLLGLFSPDIPLFNHKQSNCKKRDLLTQKDFLKWGSVCLLDLVKGGLK